MKKSKTSIHHAAAIMIDVLLVVLALLAFLFLHESTKASSTPLPQAPAVSRPAISWPGSREIPVARGATVPTALAAKPTITQVHFAGGRVVPLVNR